MQENILSKKLNLGLNFSTPSGGVTCPLLKESMIVTFIVIHLTHTYFMAFCLVSALWHFVLWYFVWIPSLIVLLLKVLNSPAVYKFWSISNGLSLFIFFMQALFHPKFNIAIKPRSFTV